MLLEAWPDDPVQADAVESPAYSDADPVEAPDPDDVVSNDPESPDDSGDAGPRSPAAPAVTWSGNRDMLEFRNADGVWTIYKRCFDRTLPGRPTSRRNVGIGYIARLRDSSGRVLVEDDRARTVATDQPGYLNAVHGGLGTFGWHHTRGPAAATPAGDDPTTAKTERPRRASRPRGGYAIEGRMCASTNHGYGIYARSWHGPDRVSDHEVAFTIDVWFRDAASDTGHGPDATGNGVGDALARVRYRYSVYQSSVRAWISVLLYPRSSSGGVPFVKEPKFSATVRGGRFRRMAVFGGDQGQTFQLGVLRGGAEGISGLLTEHSSLPRRTRVQWDYGTSSHRPGRSPVRRGAVLQRRHASVSHDAERGASSEPVRAAIRSGCRSPGKTNSSSGWTGGRARRRDESRRGRETRTEGRDRRRAATLRSQRVRTPGASSTGRVPANGPTPESTACARGSSPAGSPPSTDPSREDNEHRFTAATALFLGWKGGRGPGDCEPLERAFSSTEESWGSFATYSVGSGWERLR